MSSFYDDEPTLDAQGLPKKKSVPVDSVMQEIVEGASQYMRSVQEAWLNEKNVASKPFLLFNGLGCESTAGDVQPIDSDGKATGKGLDWEAGGLIGSDVYDPKQVQKVGGIVIATFGPAGRKVCVTSRAQRQELTREQLANSEAQILRIIRLHNDYDRMSRVREMGDTDEIESLEKNLKAQQAVINLAQSKSVKEDEATFGSLLDPQNRNLLTRKMAGEIVTNSVVRKYIEGVPDAEEYKDGTFGPDFTAAITALKAEKNTYQLQSALGIIRRGKKGASETWNDPRASKNGALSALGKLADHLFVAAGVLARLVGDCAYNFKNSVDCKKGEGDGICGLVDLPYANADGTSLKACFPADLANSIKKKMDSVEGFAPQGQVAKQGRWYTEEAKAYSAQSQRRKASAASALGLASFEDEFRGGDSVVSGGGDASLLAEFTAANNDTLSRVFGASGGSSDVLF